MLIEYHVAYVLTAEVADWNVAASLAEQLAGGTAIEGVTLVAVTSLAWGRAVDATNASKPKADA